MIISALAAEVAIDKYLRRELLPFCWVELTIFGDCSETTRVE